MRLGLILKRNVVSSCFFGANTGMKSMQFLKKMWIFLVVRGRENCIVEGILYEK